MLMRLVDILYGLPYILLVILLKIALEQPLTRFIRSITDMTARSRSRTSSCSSSRSAR